MPHPFSLSHKYPITISPICLTSHLCVQKVFMMNIDVPAGVGALPLNASTTSSKSQLELQKNLPPFLHTTLRQKWEEGVCSIIHLVLCIILCPHPTWFLVMLHTTLVDNHDNCHDLCCQFIHSLA